MESMHKLHQNGTRDLHTIDLDAPSTKESPYRKEKQLEEAGSARTNTVQTKSLFHFMELPAEIRVKIYNLLLISPDVIHMGSESSTATSSEHPYPHSAILRTCKTVEEEATPILYRKNAFTICLPINPNPTFLFSKFRWSTLQILSSLTFTSSSESVPALTLTATSFSEPSFHCTGADIIARFSPSDFRYSPGGPDRFMALSISNWVSARVMRAQMCAIQRELEAMMGTYEHVVAAT